MAFMHAPTTPDSMFSKFWYKTVNQSREKKKRNVKPIQYTYKLPDNDNAEFEWHSTKENKTKRKKK